MSHFATIVVVENTENRVPADILDVVDKQMAPFMENCCGEPDKMYMKFYDQEDEMLKQYEEGSREMVVMPDGRLLLPWDDEFKREPKEGELPFTRPGPPEGLERRQVPFKDTFSTFEEFVREWHGQAERDETLKRYGYWQNPNAKWDWYEVGGRWAGFFQLKKGRRGGKGHQYNMSGKLEESSTHADVCFHNAVDFEAMRKKCEDDAAVRFDTVWEAIKDTPPVEGWETFRAKFDLNDPNQLDEARKTYHEQPRVKAFSALGYDVIGWMADVSEYQIPREEYLKKARNNAAVPFAVLKDGKWYENGRMGMFGMAMDEKDPETWAAMVSKLMDDLPGQTILAVVDCHI